MSDSNSKKPDDPKARTVAEPKAAGQIDSKAEAKADSKAQAKPSSRPEPQVEEVPDDTVIDEEEPFERRSAQAMVATYLQMSRYTELASVLHKARLQATERRVAEAKDLSEVERLQRLIEAQQNQGETIELALDRFRRHAGDLKSFTSAGLTREDFKILGIEELLGPETETDATGGVEETR